ncbi:MAG: carbon-nitrogen hydrolase family protein [Candidatus Brocadiaceae bacterium]|nr:carbon-nitrogen hydrolase family protein [Candidatus Brocadiaceae bacterium]
MSRKARICTISMNSLVHGNRSSKEDRFREAEAKMKQGALDAPDLFLLPETFLCNDVPGAFADPANIEEEGNEAYERLGAAARAYGAYVAAPLLTRLDGVPRNSTVIFDRGGSPVYAYHKTYLTGGEAAAGLVPGERRQEAFDADFGRLGIAICYDLNFQPLLRHYYDQGVEVLLFTTYFPGGMLLRSWAYLYSFHAVSSHAQGHESMFVNPLGYVVARANMFAQALTHEFQLDCVLAPYYGNRNAVQAAKEKYGPELELDIHRAEGDVILYYHGTQTTARDIVREFEIRTRADYYRGEHLL